MLLNEEVKSCKCLLMSGALEEEVGVEAVSERRILQAPV